MSQVVVDPNEIITGGLSTITPDFSRAFLVEAFNRILVSKIDFDEPYDRGIETLIEKRDLLPFEEAKLYGHNATHALAGYIGRLCNAELVTDLEKLPGVVNFLRNAFINESGEALIKKYHQVDPLFSSEGYVDYADNLITRMFNPYLMDSIDRVTRDTERKLGWNDRLVGTVRLALHQGVEPQRYAFGVAAAVVSMDSSIQDASSIREFFNSIWHLSESDVKEGSEVLTCIESALKRIAKWQTLGFPDLEDFFEISEPELFGVSSK
jgi:mannitol-1-phosphate/altronate dehydrogenase